MTQVHADIEDGGEFCLYRLFAADGVLLYVGATHSFHLRMRGHRGKAWWLDVVESMTTVEWFPTPTQVSKAEEQAIRTENPVWNMSGRRTPGIPYSCFAESFPVDDGHVYMPPLTGMPPRRGV